MRFPTRLVNTVALLCHLLLAPPLVTSQLLTTEAHPPGALSFQKLAPFSSPTTDADDIATIKADTQKKAGSQFTLSGNVEIDYRNLVLTADEVTYNEATGEATARGNVQLLGGPHDERLQASHATYNLKAEQGRFFDVVGSTGLKVRGRRTVLTSSNPFMFRGAIVDKTGPEHYIVHHGSISVCEGEPPAWSFEAQRVVVEAGEEATIYHTTFRLRNVPVFYLPYASHPVENLGRQSGFLIPTIGQSSRKGTTLGESFFWAINRSTDATIGAEYFSHRGWAQHGTFRVRPSDDSFFEAHYFGVLDRGIAQTHQDQGGEEVTLTGQGELRGGFRAVVDADYLSAYVFRLAFNENFAQAVNSEVKSIAFISRTWRGFSINTRGARYQNFESTARGDQVVILHAPSFEFASVERALGRTPFTWSFDASAEGVSRREPGFVTDPIVGRIDLTPRLSLPLVLRGWSLRPEIALRNTYYTQRVQPNNSLGVPVSQDVNRRAVQTGLELRPPTLARIFEKQIHGRKLKHTIEPRLVYRYVSGVQNFANIIRFDARDIFSDTNELEYAVVNRLYAKRTTPAGDCPRNPVPPEAVKKQKTPASEPDRDQDEDQAIAEACSDAASVREIVTWEIGQKAFFNEDFGHAIVNGRRNVLTTTADFSGIAFLTEARVFSPLISRLRFRTGTSSDVQWNLDYDFRKGRINSSTAIASWRVHEFFFGGSHAFLHTPGDIFVTNPVPGPEVFNQYRVLAGYGHPNKRGVSFAGNVGVDSNFSFLQYGSGQMSYNWDCMGVSVEYRRLALGAVRNENQFRFSLSLANIGTFGTMRRQERLF